MKNNVSEIYNVSYGENGVCCEPSKDQIERAVNENELERRGFQCDKDEIAAECNKGGNFEEYCDCMCKYHARRIAFFVVNKWTDPIVLNGDGSIKDGLHRLKAAIYLGMEVVEIKIEKE